MHHKFGASYKQWHQLLQFADHKQGQDFHVQQPVCLLLTVMIREDDNLHILQI